MVAGFDEARMGKTDSEIFVDGFGAPVATVEAAASVFFFFLEEGGFFVFVPEVGPAFRHHVVFVRENGGEGWDGLGSGDVR